MNSGNVRQHSRIGVYWYSWMAIVALAMVSRFTVFLGASSERLFALASAYGLVTWLPIMVWNVIEGRKLLSYMRTHHLEQWEWLTYFPGLGSGMHNGFRALPWLYSADDLGDPVVASMKGEQRRFIRFMLTVFFSYLVLMPVLLGL
jgi:hypothetical protein